jgi:hypothetical protein
MSLRMASDAPQTGHEVIARHLGALYNNPSARDLFGNAGRGDLWTCPPYRSYVVSLQAAASDRLLKQPLRGWRYVVCARKGENVPEQPLFVAEVSQETGGAHVTHLSKSPHLERALAVLASAEERDSVRVSSYEVRLLEVIGLSLSAWWLHEDGQQARDLFIPLTELMPGLTYGVLYPKEAFLDLVKARAEQQIASGVQF